jgi:hypothetical protein
VGNKRHLRHLLVGADRRSLRIEETEAGRREEPQLAIGRASPTVTGSPTGPEMATALTGGPYRLDPAPSVGLSDCWRKHAISGVCYRNFAHPLGGLPDLVRAAPAVRFRVRRRPESMSLERWTAIRHGRDSRDRRIGKIRISIPQAPVVGRSVDLVTPRVISVS